MTTTPKPKISEMMKTIMNTPTGIRRRKFTLLEDFDIEFSYHAALQTYVAEIYQCSTQRGTHLFERSRKQLIKKVRLKIAEFRDPEIRHVTNIVLGKPDDGYPR